MKTFFLIFYAVFMYHKILTELYELSTIIDYIPACFLSSNMGCSPTYPPPTSTTNIGFSPTCSPSLLHYHRLFSDLFPLLQYHRLFPYLFSLLHYYRLIPKLSLPPPPPPPPHTHTHTQLLAIPPTSFPSSHLPIIGCSLTSSPSSPSSTVSRIRLYRAA